MHVYLLHFEAPIHHAKHYTGSTNDLARRFAEHFAGEGSAITAELKKRGLGFRVARVWKVETRESEYIAKLQKSGPKLCPICHPKNKRLNMGTGVPITALNRSGIRTNWNRLPENQPTTPTSNELCQTAEFTTRTKTNAPSNGRQNKKTTKIMVPCSQISPQGSQRKRDMLTEKLCKPF